MLTEGWYKNFYHFLLPVPGTDSLNSVAEAVQIPVRISVPTSYIVLSQKIPIQLVAETAMFPPPLVDISRGPEVEWFGFALQHLTWCPSATTQNRTHAAGTAYTLLARRLQ